MHALRSTPFFPLMGAAALLAACGEAGKDAAAAGTETTQSKIEAPPADDLEWRRLQLNGQSALSFGARGEPPLAHLRCDAALESIYIDRTPLAETVQAERMTVRVGDGSRRLPLIWNTDTPPTATAMLKLEDSFTDSLSRLSDDIEIVVGKDVLALPKDRRIGTLIEECRQAQLR